MGEKRLLLATAEEIRAIFSRANDILDAVQEREIQNDDIDPDMENELAGQWGPAVEAIRFCCVAAGQLGDPSLFPLIEEALELTEHINDYAADHRRTMARSIAWLLDAGAPVNEHVKAFAEHPDAEVRQSVAAGLSPSGEVEIGLLEALSEDPIPDVRNAAKRALSRLREVPWWKGKFSRDPLARLSDEEALRLKPSFTGISAILDDSLYRVATQEAELLELTRTLPSELVIDLVETLHSAADAYGTHLSSLLTLMLEQPGGVEAWKRLLPIWSENRKIPSRQDALPKMVAALPHETRAAVCKELATYAVSFAADPSQNDFWQPPHLAAIAAGSAWPPGEDLSPLLDMLLASPSMKEHGVEWIPNALSEAFATKGADPGPILERALEARVAGYPGRFRNLATAMNALLDRAPGEALRVAAERAVVSDKEGVMEWGLRRLLVQAFDPIRDGSRDDLIRRFLADPRYRPILCGSSSLCEVAVPVLREELRAGRLGLYEATRLVDLLGNFYGGVAESSMGSLRLIRPSSTFQKKLEELDAYLGPPELRGPPTDEEWRRVREARARWIADGLKPRNHGVYTIGPFPEGPWAPEDREGFDAAVQAVREGPPGSEDDLAISIAKAIAAKPMPEALDLFDDLLKYTDPVEHGMLKIYRGYAREALGLPKRRRGSPPKEGEAARDEGEAEWMDEPEDEDDD